MPKSNDYSLINVKSMEFCIAKLEDGAHRIIARCPTGEDMAEILHALTELPIVQKELERLRSSA